MSIVIETDAEETPATAAPDVFQDTSETSVTQCAIVTVLRRVNELPVPATHAWMVITGQTVQIHVAPDVELFSVDRRAGNAWTAVGRGGRGLSARVGVVSLMFGSQMYLIYIRNEFNIY